MSHIVRWFWRLRAHGFRYGVGPLCDRCGGYEFSDNHPRGFVGPDGWLR